MLDFCKQILHKVSFDRSLFEKELRKAVKWLKKDDLKSLQKWCLMTFGVMYADVIQSVFDGGVA